MYTRYYRALPEDQGLPVQPPESDEFGNPLISTICLERNNDPDANNHTGYDYWVSHSNSIELLNSWSEKNTGVLEEISYEELPNPVTFFPHFWVRARDEEGKFIADDPSTPDINEAWELRQ